MKKLRLSSVVPLTVLGLVLAISCTVDKSDFVFDDDAFDELKNGGGDGDGDGDGDIPGDGDGDGDGDMGGAGTGGMGLGGSDPGDEFEPGDTRCTGKQVEFYVGNDLWAPLGGECEYLCMNGECTGSCVPESNECLSETEERACDEMGTWVNQTCEFACVDTECGGVCTPGDRQCNDLQKQVCDETGQWVDDGAPCPSACDEPEPGSAVCSGMCTTGEKQCINNTDYQECVGSAWVDQGACEFACVNDDCGGTCVPGNSICVNNAVVACSAIGSPQTPVPCGNQTCVENGSTASCVGECAPGQQDCKDGVVRECADGFYKVSRDCPKLGDELGLPLTCVPYGPPTDKKRLCGQCPFSEETEVNRCHTAKDHPTSVEVCALDKDKEITFWKVSEECEFCYQGACVDPTETCKADRTATGCQDLGTSWYCVEEGVYDKRLCKDGFYCEKSSCEEMADPPVH